jgi:hypothetical protein
LLALLVDGTGGDEVALRKPEDILGNSTFMGFNI